MTNQDINTAIYFLKGEPPQDIKTLSMNYAVDNPKISFTKIMSELLSLVIMNVMEGKYSLNHLAEKQIESLPQEYENSPYEFFLNEFDKKNDLRNKIEELTAKNLELQNKELKAKRLWMLIGLLVGIAIAIITGYLLRI